MLKFKIFEIPEGQSQRTVQLQPEDLNLGDVPFKRGSVKIEFYKTVEFIRTNFSISATVELICDRSLDMFEHQVEKDYEVLFKTEKVAESADENGATRNLDTKYQQIDLEQDVRDTILLVLPVKKLHPRFLDQDGKPKEFFSQQFGNTLEEDEDYIDPRWEALKELKK